MSQKEVRKPWSQLPQDFDIEEASDEEANDEGSEILNIETIGAWNPIRRKLLPLASVNKIFLRVSILLWIILVVVGLIVYILTSNAVIALSSPIALIYPLLKLYFYREN